MEVSEYVINVLSAIVAVEYIDYEFPKRYKGNRRWMLFAIACILYFSVVTVLNSVTKFEGALGFLYGAILLGYGVMALEGRWQEFLLAGLLWVLIAIVGTYGIFSVMGILTGGSLVQMISSWGGGRFYASLVALVVKFSMGKIAAVFFRKKEGDHDRENGIVAGAFLFMALLAMGLFWLEMGNLSGTARYVLTIGILLDEVGIVVFLVQLYQRLGRYQREKMEERYRREQEQERIDSLMDIYRVGRELNRWRHDMQSNLDVLYQMQKRRKYTEVEKRMKELCSGLKDYPEMPQPTGNDGLDAALIKVLSKCRESGIHFHYIVLGNVSRIDSMKFGNLMNNLLSNGMEACQGLTGKREMELVVRSRPGGVEIYLENSIGCSVLKKNPDLNSSKQDKERHGFGLESIRRIVEECGGTYEYWEEYEEENKFCQCIYLTTA